VIIKNKGGSGNTLAWKWLDGDAPLAEFGDPRATTRYALCVYDAASQVSAVKLSIEVAPASLCSGSPCWSPSGGVRGFRFVDSSGAQQGAKKLLLKGGKPGKDKLRVKAGGLALTLPPPASPTQYFTQQDDVTVQLVNDVGGCWESVFSPATVLKNQSALYKAKQ
jgi:hypothetical protein